MLAACAAPAIVRADSLMRIVSIETAVLIPSLDIAFTKTLTLEELAARYIRRAQQDLADRFLIDLTTSGLPNR